MMHYIWIGIIGLLAGALGKFLLPGKDPGGIIVTMLIGIAGSFVGKYLSELMGLNFLNGFGGAVIGSILLLIGWRFISTKVLS